MSRQQTRPRGEAGERAVPLHRALADELRELIERGTYRAGERIPSIRSLSRLRRVSIGTVTQAYAHLECARLVEARPQSGYYVLGQVAALDARGPAAERPVAAPVVIGAGPLQIMRALSEPSLVPLGTGVSNPELLPIGALSRMLATQARRFKLESVSYAGASGLLRLRTQIAKRSLEYGCRLAPDDLVVTSGCVEAVSLALQATCKPGDVVAVASPVFNTFLNAIQWLGLRVLEIPASPGEGLNLEVLQYALEHTPIRACLAIPNFDNPLGSLMPDERKRELVALLARHEVPLIEDDVYGDLAFGDRPVTAKAFDRKGLVLLCSSFSKTLAPGYRVGFIAPGRYREKVESLKSLLNIATASPTQLAVAEFLADGGYDRHLRALRRTYRRQMAQAREAIARHFPPGTTVTSPRGGFILWLKLPEPVDTMRLCERALRQGIGVAPGNLFSLGEAYRRCLRLNAARWSQAIQDAVATVGRLACELARSGPER